MWIVAGHPVLRACKYVVRFPGFVFQTSSKRASTLPTSSRTLGHMKSYPVEHWKALGEWVSVARHQSDYSDMKKWAAAVGRSTRMLQGLERGETVGAKTIEAIAEVLGVANWSLFSILDRGTAEEVEWSPTNVREARARYESETGLEADDGETTSLTYISDEDLLAELERRLSTRKLTRTERLIAQMDRWDEADKLNPRDRLAVEEVDRERQQESIRRQHGARAVDDARPENERGTAG